MGARPELSTTRRLCRALAVLLAGCGHAPQIVESTTLGACPGATITPIGRPTWATTADLERDGGADLLLLDVLRPAGTAVVVPLRASARGWCQDTAIAVPIAAPSGRRMRIAARDVTTDGIADLVVWNQEDGETAVLPGADAAPFFGPPVKMQVPGLELRDEPSRELRDAAEVDARGRLYVTSPDHFVVARERGQRAPPTGRNRVPTPFAPDYAVYLDLRPDLRSELRTLVIGAGKQLAIQDDRTAPNRWRVLRLR